LNPGAGTASNVPQPDVAPQPVRNTPKSHDNTAANRAPSSGPEGDKPADAEPPPVPTMLFHLRSGEAARVRRKGEGGYRTVEGGLAEGDALRVERGEARIESPALFAALSDRGEVEVVAEHSLRLGRGRLVVRVLREECAFTFNDASITASIGEYVIGVLSGLGQLEVMCGRARVALGDADAVADAGTMTVLSGSLQVLPLDEAALASLRAEVDSCITPLMRWDFDAGSGSCDLGRVVEGGVSGGHALRWDPTQPGAGTSLWLALFKAVPASRLRVWVLTDAASVDVTARMHLPEGVRGVFARLAVPPGTGWRMIDVPLDVFQGGSKRDQPGFVAGAEYSGLQFSVPPSREELLVSKPLAIDDVTVYALAR
jgi:hypothetical protein